MEKETIEEGARILSESIKLTHSVTGKVGWEIRIFPTTQPNDIQTLGERLEVDSSWINRLEKLNNKMIEKFGGEEDVNI